MATDSLLFQGAGDGVVFCIEDAELMVARVVLGIHDIAVRGGGLDAVAGLIKFVGRSEITAPYRTTLFLHNPDTSVPNHSLFISESYYVN